MDDVDKIEESLARVNLNIDKQKEGNAINESNSTGDKSEEHIVKLLEELHCPFTWKPENEASNAGEGVTTISRVEEKDEEVEDEEGEFQWRRYILKLVLIYEHFKTKHYSGCQTVLREAEQLAICSDIQEKNADFYNSIKDAIFHSLLATKVHLMFHDQIFGEAERTAMKIKKANEMDNSNKAALYAMQAAVWMEYGYSGTKKALDLINKALDLDSEVGEWLFLKGKCLGRIRRIDHYNEVPCPEEMRSLEKAAELTQKASHKVFLAQSYREASFRAFSLHRNDMSSDLKDALNTLNERSLKYYRQALETRGTCARINARCALGFLKLPYPQRDIELAKKCIDKAYALAPNNAMINHITAKVYESKGMIDQAMEHYKTSGEQGAFGSHMDLARLMYTKDNSYNPVPDFEKLLLKYKELPLQIELICQIGAYYLFVKDSLTEAYKYWEKAMDLDPDSEKLRVHKCVLLHMKKPVNIYEVLLDEARLLNKTADSSEKRIFCRKVILKCADKVPDLMDDPPQPRRKMVWEEIESSANNRSRSRFQKNQRGDRGFVNRGRGRGGERGRSNWVNRGGMQRDQPRRKPHSRDSSRDSCHSTGSKDRKGSVSRRYSDKGYGNFHNNRSGSQNRNSYNNRRSSPCGSGNDTSYEFRGEKKHNYQDQKSSYNRNRDGRSGRDSPNTVSETNYGNTAGHNSRHFNRDKDASRNSYGSSNYHRGGYTRDDNTYSRNYYKSGHSSSSKEYRRYNHSPSHESCNGSSPDRGNRNFDGRYSHSDHNSSRRYSSNVYQRRNSKDAARNRSSGRERSSSVESCSDGNKSFRSESRNMKPKKTVDTDLEAGLVNLQEASRGSHDTDDNQKFLTPREKFQARWKQHGREFKEKSNRENDKSISQRNKF